MSALQTNSSAPCGRQSQWDKTGSHLLSRLRRWYLPDINSEFPPPGVLPDIEQYFGIDDGKSGLLQTGGSVTGAMMSQNPTTDHNLIMCSPLSFHLQLHVPGPSLRLPGRQVQQEGHHVRWDHVLVLGDPRQLLHPQRSESAPAERSVNPSGSFNLTDLSRGLAAFLGPVADSRPGRRRRGQLLNYRSHHHRRPLREGKEDEHAVHLLFCHSSGQVGRSVGGPGPAHVVDSLQFVF